MTHSLGSLPQTPASPTWSSLLALGELQCRAAATLSNSLARAPCVTASSSAATRLPVRRTSVAESTSSRHSDASLLEQRWEHIQQDLMRYRKLRPQCLETGEPGRRSHQPIMTTDTTSTPASSSVDAASWELWNTLMDSDPVQGRPTDESLGTALPHFPAVWSSFADSEVTSDPGGWQTAEEAATSSGSVDRTPTARTGFRTMSPATPSSFTAPRVRSASDGRSETFERVDVGRIKRGDAICKPACSRRPASSNSEPASTSRTTAPSLYKPSASPLMSVAGRAHSTGAVSQDTTAFSPTSTLFDGDAPALASPWVWSSAGKAPPSPVRHRVSRPGSATTLREQCWTPVGLRQAERDPHTSRKVRGDKEGLLTLVDMLSATEPGEKRLPAIPCDRAHSTDGGMPHLTKRTSSLALAGRRRAQSSVSKQSEDTLYEGRESLGHSHPEPLQTSTEKAARSTKTSCALQREVIPAATLRKTRDAAVERISAREAQREVQSGGGRVSRQPSIMVFWRPERPSKTI
jgi:hypothetical protein